MKRHNWTLIKCKSYAHDPTRYDWKCKDCGSEYSTYDDDRPPVADAYEYGHHPKRAKFLDGCDILMERARKKEGLWAIREKLCQLKRSQ